jgi:hypothetical protein
MRTPRVNSEELVSLYQSNVDIKDICLKYNLSRVSVYAYLKRAGVDTNRKNKRIIQICKFCEESYSILPSRVKQQGPCGGYCSHQCYAADNGEYGEYGKFGGRLTAINTQTGVYNPISIHFIDGNQDNVTPDNMRAFESHWEHIQYHRELLKK